jgi:AcrR family transcriptional regulator
MFRSLEALQITQGSLEEGIWAKHGEAVGPHAIIYHSVHNRSRSCRELSRVRESRAASLPEPALGSGVPTLKLSRLRVMGRPREFDEDTALERALHVFWERGYEGASLHELLDAMELIKPSLYKAFSSKENLFRKVRQKYQNEHLAYQREALAQPTSRKIAEHLLIGTIGLPCGETTPLGCLETNGALACSSENDAIRLDLARSRDYLRSALRLCFDSTDDQGSLPAGMSSDDAAFLVPPLCKG